VATAARPRWVSDVDDWVGVISDIARAM